MTERIPDLSKHRKAETPTEDTTEYNLEFQVSHTAEGFVITGVRCGPIGITLMLAPQGAVALGENMVAAAQQLINTAAEITRSNGRGHKP